MKINYKLKADILNNHQDIIKLEKEMHRAIRNQYEYFNSKEEKDAYVSTYKDLCADSEIFNEARKINHSRFCRTLRINKVIEWWIEISKLFGIKLLFITLTFNDKTLKDTTEQTRRKYVQRFLLSQSEHYIANQDYGKENDREHYHAVLLMPDGTYKKDYLSKKWKYGFSYTEVIRCNDKDNLRISKYISKLTNHTIKQTNKRSVVIYSKNKREIDFTKY